MASRTDREVLIVGAGPTGLVLAIWLRRLGIGVRIIDRTAEPGTTSRALAVHARTLELYRQLGLAHEVVERGIEFAAVNLWVAGKHEARVPFYDLGKGLSPFPYIVMFPQDEHEQLLVDRLRQMGVEVERRTELLDFDFEAGRVVARIERAGSGIETCEASYIAGCDGAHSKVREILDIGFKGGTYEHLFYVANVELRGPMSNHELHVVLDSADLLAVFPMKGPNAARLIGTLEKDAEPSTTTLEVSERSPNGALKTGVDWKDVSHRIIAEAKIKVDRLHWFSTYRVHHRVATSFARGRAFLLGDAAHIHSPVGGQGMNTGIGDAVNLAWKLAAVLRGRAPASLLDSYEPERIAFARRLVRTTDRVFAFVSRDGAIARYVRTDALPRILPRLADKVTVRRFMFKTVSQILVSYKRGPLAAGKAGDVRGGDRLPWVQPSAPGAADNFTPLDSVDWQVHVYGTASQALAAACEHHGVRLHRFPFSAAAQEAGLQENASYFVRPDGYVALADSGATASALDAYIEKLGLRLRQ